MPRVQPPKPPLRIYFDVETYTVNKEEPLDYPHITEIPTGLIDPKTGLPETRPRKVVNTFVYGIAWTYVRGKVHGICAKNPGKYGEFEWEDQVSTMDIPEGYQTYRVEWGKHCLIKFIDELLPLTDIYTVHLIAYNTTFDFHQMIWDIKEYLQSKFGKEILIINSLLGNKIQIKGELVIKFKHEKRQRKFVFRDLWQFHKSKGMREWLNDLKKAYGINSEKKYIEYGKYDMEFDEDGQPLKYKTRKDGVFVDEDFDWAKESEYLHNDVIWLPLIRKEIEMFKLEIIDAVYPGIMAYNTKQYDMRRRIQLCVIKSVTEGGFSKRLQDTMLRNVFGSDKRLKEIIPNFSEFKMNPNDKVSKSRGSLYDAIFRPPGTAEELDQQNASYYGGFVSGNRNIYDLEGKLCILIDVNSMYPWVMSGYMPYGELLDKKPYCYKSNNEIEDENYCVWYLIEGTTLPQWRKQYDFFDNNFLGKCFFDKSYFTGRADDNKTWWILKDYWDLMKQMCHIDGLVILETYYMRTRKLMKPYIDKVMQVKKEYTPTKNGSGRKKYNASKVLANSAYGKLAEKPHEDTLEYDNKESMYKRTVDIEYRQLYAGMFVTSMSRVKLLGTIKDLIDKGNTFLYCDTDSILLQLSGYYQDLDIHPDALGKWDIEKIFNRFVYNGKRKKYCIEYCDDLDTNKELDEFIDWYAYKLNITREQIIKSLKEKKERKGATSGYSKKILSDIEDWDYIRILYNPTECVVIKNGKKVAAEDSYTFKKRLDLSDGLFNRDVDPTGWEVYLEDDGKDGKWKIRFVSIE